VIELGLYNDLKILRETSVGLYLGSESGEEVLLPNKYVPEKFEIGDMIEVFAYRDSEERKVTTTLIPDVFLYEFAFLQVKVVSEIGAFLDWGLEKDLFVPFREQKMNMEPGRWYVIYLNLDNETDRLFGSNKVEKYLQNDDLLIEEGEEVDLLVYRQTELGFSVIVNDQHRGLLYNNEVFREINIGDEMIGYIKKIREDNKIDVSLQPIGIKVNYDANAEMIYNKLVANDGFLAVNDKSTPNEIYFHFKISKKAF